MRTKHQSYSVCLLVALILLMGSVSTTDGFELDLTVFGEVGSRATNLFKEEYGHLGGWMESRLAIRNLAASARLVGVSPYLKGVITLSNHTQLPEENVLVYGVGLELRLIPMPCTNSDSVWGNRIGHIRLYGEYLKADFLRRKVGSWIPLEDWRFGAEMWRELNVELGARTMNPSALTDRLWAELWGDVSYKRSNFFLEDYDSWTSALVIRAGIRFPEMDPTRDVFLMPYAMLEHSSSQRRFAWQNRMLSGVGVRVMPFPHALTTWLRRFRFFAEYAWMVQHYADDSLPGTPDNDLRVGFSFSNTWR